MQKSDVKSDKITVGVAAHSYPLKQNKGITLIALIITIIVMLILVGATINVALNGGLFQKAEQAKTQTQREVEIEELTTIAIAAYNEKTKKIDQNKLELGEKYTIVSDKTTEEKIVVTGQYGITWQIDVVSGRIEEYVENTVPTRVPFTNYIENGNNYYINGPMVMEFSKQQGIIVTYSVDEVRINSKHEEPIEVVDKNQIETMFNNIVDFLEGELEITFAEINDDAILINQSGRYELVVFKNNYEEAFIGDRWYTLDTEYTLPSE